MILLEQSLKEPDRIVGELLQPGGVLALEKLGLRGMSTLLDSSPWRRRWENAIVMRYSRRERVADFDLHQTASKTSTPSPAKGTT